MVNRIYQGTTETKVIGARIQERNKKCCEHLKVKDVASVAGLRVKVYDNYSSFEK